MKISVSVSELPAYRQADASPWLNVTTEGTKHRVHATQSCS